MKRPRPNIEVPQPAPVEIPVAPIDTPAPEIKPRAAGLICRSCGCRLFRVNHTVPLSNGKIRRYRECHNCGRGLVTIEMPR